MQQPFINIFNYLTIMVGQSFLIFRFYIRFLILKLRRKLRHYERKIGYKFSDISNAFSVATLFLIFFKLCFRIFNYNPSSLINLLLLAFFTILCLKVNIFPIFKEKVKQFWRFSLGEWFYYSKYITFAELWDNCLYFDEDDFYDKLEELKQKQSFLNKIMQKFFIVLIYLRLWIISETYLFFVFNTILIYFLIINKYLILSSIFSIIFAASKWTFHLEDYTLSAAIKSIRSVVIFERNHYFAPTWENSEFLAIWIVRHFDVAVMDEHKTEKDKEWFDLKRVFVPLEDKLKQFNHPILKKIEKINYCTCFVAGEEKPDYETFLKEHALAKAYEIYLHASARKVREKSNMSKEDQLNVDYLFETFFHIKLRNEYFYYILISCIFLFIFQRY